MTTQHTHQSWNLRLPLSPPFLTMLLAASTPFAIHTPAHAATVMAQEGDEQFYEGEAPYRYASVKVLEGDVRIRKGDVDEVLSRGTPIAEGDVVDSRGRGVLQLGDGTRVAFGRNTHFTIAALFTEKDGSRQVLLRLDRGSLRLNYGSESEGRIRIDTPSGTAVLDGKANVTVGVDSDRSVKVHVASGRIVFSNERDQARILAGERLTVYSSQDALDRVRSYNTYEQDDFDSWSDSYMLARRGASWDNVPSDIRYYSDDLDDNGSWVDVPEVGRCWSPRVGYDDWRPYSRGRWGAYSGGLTWVSDEPWGYVTHHYGRWGWGASFGWYWIPGSFYSPAWVAWNWSGGFCGWAPMGYYNQPCSWGYGAWNGYHAWNVVNVNYINATNLRTRLVSDHNVIVNMSGGTGATTWASRSRSLTPPWRTGPVIATRQEFQNPRQLGTAFNRSVAQDRLNTYSRAAQSSTGRTVNLTPQDRSRTAPVPFENRDRGASPTSRGVLSDRSLSRPVDRTNPEGRGSSRTTETPRAIDRPRDLNTGRDTRPIERPVDRPRDLNSGRDIRPIERPVDRTKQPATRQERPTPIQRERTPDRPREIQREERPAPTRDRPRDEYRPIERQAPREYTPAPRQESRPAPREYQPAPRQESRPAQREESRPSRQESQPSPRQESQPAPRQESRPSSPPADRGDRGGSARRG
ncbi:MAG: FecR domain-containing protein [Holophagaceae bacterium]|nr:FecR domain-containing protein [Holophagaceae bacterium]